MGLNTRRFQGDHNNNKIERFNGEVRDREKVMRGLKKKDTPILTGYQIFYNYFGLNGKHLLKLVALKLGEIINGLH
jgi:hypothetical protein